MSAVEPLLRGIGVGTVQQQQGNNLLVAVATGAEERRETAPISIREINCEIDDGGVRGEHDPLNLRRLSVRCCLYKCTAEMLGRFCHILCDMRAQVMIHHLSNQCS